MQERVKITSKFLDDLTIRFLLNSEAFHSQRPEEYFSVLEEAHWYAVDFYNIAETNLLHFAQIILGHNGLDVDVGQDFEFFRKYRQAVKVFGCIIFSRDYNHVLLVEQDGNGGKGSITFPKGKKNKDEDGITCAARETYEEVGLNVKEKIVNLSVSIFDKMTFYCVFNVDMDYPFETRTRNEISRIFWFNLNNVKHVKNNPTYKIFYTAYKAIEDKIKVVKSNLFKFDVNEILKRIENLN